MAGLFLLISLLKSKVPGNILKKDLTDTDI
jgi:hypothetical protein